MGSDKHSFAPSIEKRSVVIEDHNRVFPSIEEVNPIPRVAGNGSHFQPRKTLWPPRPISIRLESKRNLTNAHFSAKQTIDQCCATPAAHNYFRKLALPENSPSPIIPGLSSSLGQVRSRSPHPGPLPRGTAVELSRSTVGDHLPLHARNEWGED